MIRVLKYPSKRAEIFLRRIFRRVEEFPKNLVRAVEKIGRDVLKEGDQALIKYTEQFDGVTLNVEEFRVSAEEIEKAFLQVDRTLIEAIKIAEQRIRAFHERALQQSWFFSDDFGSLLGQLITPVESAGLYIPGGKGGETPLISTVLMTAIPAKIAGVKRVVVVSPPRRDKTLHPGLLIACHIAGVDEIYRVGGPWSIFALAYGTQTISPVELICGPGNIYVTLAKKIVSERVGIDLIAGPSEVLIIADSKADSEFIVWDLFAQAEHDPMSLSLLISPSRALISKVKDLISKALKETERADIIEEALRKRGALIEVDSLETAFELANRIAPEHLEILVENPEAWLPYVKNAGAVFLGSFTPEAVGDYLAGPNHVLPTMGFARFMSGLSVDRFIKKVNFIRFSPEGLKRLGDAVVTLALNENLPAHAEAVKVRLRKMSKGG